MSTPRQITASEVVKGMRVRVEREHPASGPMLAYTVVFEGIVSEVRSTSFTVGDLPVNEYTFWHDSSDRTTVTVLAEPEPEWVEGAWYWCEFPGGDRRPMFRASPRWSAFENGRGMTYIDDEVTVLGRVLIVDWPGDDVARAVLEMFPNVERNDWQAEDNIVCQAVSDVIRTQGGIR